MRIWSRKDAEGYGRWGIRQNWMDNRKSISSQLLKGYTHNLSNQTKVSRRAQFSEQKTCPEIQVYFLRTLLTYLGKTKSCTSFSFGRLVVTALTDIHQTSKPGDRAPTAGPSVSRSLLAWLSLGLSGESRGFAQCLSHQTVQVVRR